VSAPPLATLATCASWRRSFGKSGHLAMLAAMRRAFAGEQLGH